MTERLHFTSREINPDYSLEGLMLKLKFQYFGHLMHTDDSLGHNKKVQLIIKTTIQNKKF